MMSHFHARILLLLLVGLLVALQQEAANAYRMAVVPKETASVGFFGLAFEGCVDQAALTDNFTCYYTGTYNADVEGSLKIINELIDDDTIDAISISVTDAEAYTPVINHGIAKGKPIFTYDSDAPDSNRLAYVGTDNLAMGRELAKLLKQIKPVGGTFGIVSGLGPNLAERVQGVREILKDSPWVEVQRSPKMPQEGKDHSIEWALAMMWELVEEYPEIDAIISVAGLPMFNENTTDWKHFVDSNRQVLTVIADTLPIQLDLMQTSYVDALVGQLPWAMGSDSVKVTKKVLDDMKNGIPMTQSLPSDVIFGTHQLEVLRIPLQLPAVDFDYNYIGKVVIVGYVLCAIVLGTSMAFMGWTWYHRNARVVRLSQPVFLAMICTGTLLMGSAMIPLSIDDTHGQTAADIACMCSPWLINIGFTVSFSALFSKTWRLNKIFLNPNPLRRVKVTEKDTMWPFLLLLSINVISLICWTVIAPLRFVRTFHDGTDPWNRPIGSYGQCISTSGAAGDSIPYLVIIAVVNMTALVVANFQSYRARNVSSEFNESTYVAMANASFLQAIMVCVPIIFLTRENPMAYYVVLSVVLFILSEAILVCIFVPKMNALKEERKNRNTRRRSSLYISGLNLSSSSQTPPTPGGDPVQALLQQYQALSWEEKVAVQAKLAPPSPGSEQTLKHPSATFSKRESSGSSMDTIPEDRSMDDSVRERLHTASGTEYSTEVSETEDSSDRVDDYGVVVEVETPSTAKGDNAIPQAGNDLAAAAGGEASLLESKSQGARGHGVVVEVEMPSTAKGDNTIPQAANDLAAAAGGEASLLESKTQGAEVGHGVA